MSSAQPSAEEIRLAIEDRADNSHWDNRTFKADKRGVSGIPLPQQMLGRGIRQEMDLAPLVHLEFGLTRKV